MPLLCRSQKAGTALFAIGTVERDTGIGRDTLRIWERRYGFPTPERNDKGERVFSAEQPGSGGCSIKGCVQAKWCRSVTRRTTSSPPHCQRGHRARGISNLRTPSWLLWHLPVTWPLLLSPWRGPLPVMGYARSYFQSRKDFKVAVRSDPIRRPTEGDVASIIVSATPPSRQHAMPTKQGVTDNRPCVVSGVGRNDDQGRRRGLAGVRDIPDASAIKS